MGGDVRDEAAVEVDPVAETELLLARGTARTSFPPGGRALVPSDVDPGAWEKFADFVPGSERKLERARVAHAEHVFGDTPHRPDLVGAYRAREIRVSCE